ncbi:MAG: DedA family protein [Chlamydiae bacterium]|jgi:uncharacterized membrane protein YdjX (TVP38/TMEM64 family)|nr:DedA family protein [Chlamydiota bacterium]
MDIFFWRKTPKWKTTLYLIALIIFIVMMILLNIRSPISFAILKEKYSELILLEKAHPIYFTASLFLFYIISVSLVIPDSIFLSLLAGALYPLPIAILFISLSEMIGALIFFLVFKKGFYTYVKKKEISLLNRLSSDDFHHHEIWYLLFLRIAHIVPFWFTNVVAILFKTKPTRFMWTTFVGTLPLSAIIAQAGHELEVALMQNTPFSLKNVFSTQTDLLLLALGVLMLLPILIKKYVKIS